MATCVNVSVWLFQSAPADCRRENNIRLITAGHTLKFQSAPADCRRENSGVSPRWTIRTSFNPLPPTVGGESGRRRAPVDRPGRFFQSAPADCRREYRHGGVVLPLHRFRSAPADCRRENAKTGCEISVPPVSIRSRRLSAGEWPHRRWSRPSPTFQSAPADCRRENVVVRGGDV